jgi:hypothetical protein
MVGDGDPLDICVLAEKTVSHGDILVPAIVIGGLRMRRDTVTRGRLPQRLPQDRRVREKISGPCRELGQEDSTAR